jgi:hypothetical protein
LRGGTVFVLAIVTAAAAFAVYYYRPHFGVCSEQSAIGDERGPIERAALDYIGALQAGDEQRAAQSMSQRGRAASQQEPLAPVIAFMRQFPAVGEPRIQRTFRVIAYGWPRAGAMSACQTALVGLGETGATAHVLVSEDIGFGERTSAVWLEREEDVWRPRGMWANITGAGGYDGERLWRMAQEQRARGHDINAGLLYSSAEQMLFRGPLITPHTLTEFRRDKASFQAPQELAGPAPHSWRLGNDAFTVTKVRFNITTDEGVVFEVHQRLPRWEGEAAADARNHALIDAYDAAHPEWREIAGALSVRTEMPAEGQLYGTVFDRGAGYTQPPGTSSERPPQN